MLIEPETLAPLLDQEFAALQRMLSVLQQEKDSLVDAPPAELLALSDEKQKLARELDTLTRQQNQVLRGAGMAEGLAGLQQLTGAVDSGDRLPARVNEIVAIATQCKKLNDIIGRTVRQNTHQIRRKVAILQGRSMEPEGYGRDGDIADTKQSGSLGRA